MHLKYLQWRPLCPESYVLNRIVTSSPYVSKTGPFKHAAGYECCYLKKCHGYESFLFLPKAPITRAPVAPTPIAPTAIAPISPSAITAVATAAVATASVTTPTVAAAAVTAMSVVP